jgi:hypothetical protein
MSTTADTSTNRANEPRVPVLGDNRLRALDNDALASAAPRVISPQGVPGEVVDDQHRDLLQTLFGNDTAAVRKNIPSQHLCPIIQEPPFDAIHFDVPSANGTMIPNQQVYKRLVLYQCIATPGALSARRNIMHPLTRVPIARNRAWDFVRPIDTTLLETLHCERLALGLFLEDDNPLNEDNDVRYEQTMRLCESR